MFSESSQAACLTCYGRGETATETGLGACPDCGGTGLLPPRDVLVEWRIAAVEKRYASGDSEATPDINWLAFELRRARQALTKILALAQEDAVESQAKHIRFAANEALGVYEPKDATTALGQSLKE
jgi:hypothetical protein